MTKTAATIVDKWVDLATDLRGYLAYPDDGLPHPAVVVFIEAFGVNSHFQKLAVRLAEAGYTALVPDLYHGNVFEYADFTNAIAHLRSLNDDQVMGEARAALEFLRTDEHAKDDIAVLGFCMGGRYAFLANAELGDRLHAAVAFYGGGIAPEQDPAGRKPLLDRVPEMKAPLLLQYGSADQSIQPAEHARIIEALSAASKRYSLEVYPNAGHGFFCDDRPSFDADAADASWKRTLGFLAQHLGD